MLSKTVSIIQDSDKHCVNIFWLEKNEKNVFCHCSRTRQTICKTRDSFINWTCRKFVLYLLQCDFKFKNCVGLQMKVSKLFRASLCRHDLHFIQICRVIKWLLFLFKHLRTASMEELLRDRCNACRAPCISLNLPLHLPAVSCPLQWTLGAEINKQLQLLLATKLTLKLRHSDVTVV